MTELFLQRLISLKNILYSVWNNSPRKFILGAFLIIFSVIGVYLGMWEGINFIVSLGGLGTIIIKKLLFILFFILFFMIAVSFGVMFYGVGIRSKETRFLLSLPINEKEVVLYKFIETFALTCWIPFLGIFIFFLGYSQVGNINIILPLLSSLYTLPFLIISCFLGYLGVLFIARFFNLKKILLGIVVLFLFLCVFYYRYFEPSKGRDILCLLSEEVAFLKISKIWFLPFSWSAHGLVYFENSLFLNSIIYFLNLWSLAGLCLCSVPKISDLFMQIYYSQSSTSKKLEGKDYIKSLIYNLKIFSEDIRPFIVKDVKYFLRESTLKLQFLIFFGILFFYFLNLRRLSYHLLGKEWKNILTFLNTFSILCITSAITIRFVFPQWSLEGNNFWIIKLIPMSLKKIFQEKFIVAFGILFLISTLLLLLSNYMLKVEMLIFIITFFIIAVSTFTLVAFSLGLGGYFVNFKQDYYLKAVESLGGFITLVASFGYVFLTIFLFGVISHLYYTKRINISGKALIFILILWTIVSLLLSFLISNLGLKKLERKDY